MINSIIKVIKEKKIIKIKITNIIKNNNIKHIIFFKEKLTKNIIKFLST